MANHGVSHTHHRPGSDQRHYYNQGSSRGLPALPNERNDIYPPFEQLPGPPAARQLQHHASPVQYYDDPAAQRYYGPPAPSHQRPPPPGYPPCYPNRPFQAFSYVYPSAPPHVHGPPPPTPSNPQNAPLPNQSYYCQRHSDSQPNEPKPRKRAYIACNFCRKRKIRCEGYDSASDGRCKSCIVNSEECLFHPVSSQTTFVPAAAIYGPNGVTREQPPQFSGAFGQPLKPVEGQGQPNGQYPPPGQYPTQPYSSAGSPQYAHQRSLAQGEGYTQAALKEHSNETKRGLFGAHYSDGARSSSLSSHPSSRLRTIHKVPSSGDRDGEGANGEVSVSPTSSAMSLQSHPIENTPHTNANTDTNLPTKPFPQSARTVLGGCEAALPSKSAGHSTSGRNRISIRDIVNEPLESAK